MCVCVHSMVTINLMVKQCSMVLETFEYNVSLHTLLSVMFIDSNYVGFSVIIMVTSNDLSLALPPLLSVQPVVDAFDPSLLVAPAISHMINFTSIKRYS